MKQVRPNEEDLQSKVYLGWGAFSNAVKPSGKEFMKIPKSASLAKILVREAKILRQLQRENVLDTIPNTTCSDGVEVVSSIRTVI